MSKNHNQYPANALWVELSTRITTQTLHYRSGNEETAAESVHKLFAKTRDLLEKYPKAKDFQILALGLLNNTLRPYTARWHGWMTESRENGQTTLVFKNPQVRRKFRAELKSLRSILQQYQKAFRALADGEHYPPIHDYGGNSDINPQQAQLGAALVAGIPTTDSKNNKAFHKINRAEYLEILARRTAFKIPVDDPLTNTTGLALSGGGIRSATFCLGIVQTLAKRKLFQQFDYLSTVSGGGYLGSFLSSTLIKDPSDHNKSPQALIDEVLIQHNGKESNAVHHLRNSSKYLGTGGIQWMAGLMVFGILTNLLLLLPVPLFAAIAAYLLQNDCGFWLPDENTTTPWLGLQASPAGYLLMYLIEGLLVLGFVLPCVQSVTHGKPSGIQARFRSLWEKFTLYAAIASLFFAVLYWLPTGFQQFRCFQGLITSPDTKFWPLLTTTLLPFLLAYGAKLLNAWKRVQTIVMNLFVLSGPLFFITVFLVVGNRLGIGEPAVRQNHWLLPDLLGGNCPVLAQHSDFAWVLFGTLFLLIWGWFFVNINTSSPHRYYRNRLCECYLLKRTGNEVAPGTELPLHKLSPEGSAAPYHLVNTTLNLTTSKNPELRGRNGDFFMISKHYCGAAVLGYSGTQNVVAKDPHIDLGSAMAISGAAASTNMGWQSRANLRFWLGLMNIRLGYWLRNPSAKVHLNILEGPGPWYLFKEIFGRMKETDRYLNLSDGGHIENLAVYELLRRRCKFIVCIDGGQEPGMECADLIRLQRYAEIDLGIRMEYDLSDLQFQELHQSWGQCHKLFL